MATKTRKISYNTIVSKTWNTQAESPFDNIETLVKFILKLKKIEKRFDMKDNKFCLLESGNIKTDGNGNAVISGYFKSARNNHSPNLIDKNTGDERKSPKKLTEGDVEKTHYLIKKTSNELYMLVETNGHGVSVNQIIEYFDRFSKRYCLHIGVKKNYSIKHYKMGKNNFLSEVQSMKRVKVAKIYFDKQLLGGNCLDFSNRHSKLQRDLELTVKALKTENITETAIDFYNKFSSSNNDSISKVRIEGKDKNGTDVVIDTTFMELIASDDVNINPLTGEVETRNILTIMENLSLKLN